MCSMGMDKLKRRAVRASSNSMDEKRAASMARLRGGGMGTREGKEQC